jgi:ATP-binding cassette subfamily B protein
MKHLAYLNKYFFRYKMQLVWGVLFTAASNIFAVYPAQLVRRTFDLVSDTLKAFPNAANETEKALLNDKFISTILWYGVVIVGMALIRGVFLFLMRQTIIVMSRKIEFDLKNDIYAHYQTLPLSFYRKNNTGDLMNRISEDVGEVRMYLGPGIMYSVNMLVTAVITIFSMLLVNPKLTFYALLPLPILSVSIYYVNSIMNKRSDAIQRQLSAMSTFVQEAFSGIRVIKAFAREKDSYQKFKTESEEYKDRSMALIKVEGLFFPVMTGLIGLSTVLTVYIGGLEVIKGTLTAGNIAEFVIYINLLTWPFTSLGWVTSIVQRASASQKRINEFLLTKTDIVSEKNLKKPIEGKITFENVSFKYAGKNTAALKNISFTVNKGETLAILGTTGSGKSTLANLLCRMYDASEGSIKIDDEDIKNYNMQHLRSYIGYVPQDVFLFSDTIKNNIAFGAAHASITEIEQAAKDADIYENIMTFPLQFETVVGERGITLSGGQKQRTSIARALIRRPTILLLDDCLSAVDTKTENTILNNLKEIMANRTAVIISHRVSSAKLADKIIVLNEGEIIEAGTPQELYDKNGIYRELYEKQLKAEETSSPINSDIAY